MKLKNILIAASFLIFIAYISWASHYAEIQNAHGAWGLGIWIVAVGCFITGILFHINDKK